MKTTFQWSRPSLGSVGESTSNAKGILTESEFRRILDYERALADRHERFFSLLVISAAEDRKAQRPGLIMAAIYRTLLDEIEADGFLVLDRRTSLTPLRKIWIAGRTWFKG